MRIRRVDLEVSIILGYILFLREFWEEHLRALYLVSRISFCSYFNLSSCLSLNFNWTEDYYERLLCSVISFLWDLDRYFLSILTLAKLDSCRRDSSCFFFSMDTSFSLIDCYLFSYKSWISFFCSFNLKFYYIFLCNLAFICFSKSDTYICILFSLISLILFSNYFFCLSVYFIF